MRKTPPPIHSLEVPVSLSAKERYFEKSGKGVYNVVYNVNEMRQDDSSHIQSNLMKYA